MSKDRIEYSVDRPYKVHSTDSTDAIRAFMQWLQEMGLSTADPVGIAVGEDGLALAQGEDLYLVSPGEQGKFARGALAAAIMGAAPPRLVSTNAEDTLVELNHFLLGYYPACDFFGRSAQCMIGDLLSCAATVGHAPAARDLSLPDAAYTARLLEPQYQQEAPPYYVRVSLPLVRLRAEWRLFGTDAPAEWWVSYPDLWIRVLTHYTADPTLTWMLNEGQEPVPAIARLFEWPVERTVAILLWHICGRSVDVMQSDLPHGTWLTTGHVEALPDDLPAVAGLWDRRLPSLWAGITSLMQGYSQNRLARTLYGRKMLAGQHPGAASAHTILGTAQDIMEVAAVTFWNKRPGPSVMIKRVDSFAVDPVRRVVGVGPQAVEREQWIETLTALAPLAAPLGMVRLAPTVVRPPEESPAVPASRESTRSSSGPSGTTPTTPTPGKAQGGSTSTGKSRRAKKQSRTKPSTSAADPRPSRATAAARSSASSPGKSRAKSSRRRKPSS